MHNKHQHHSRKKNRRNLSSYISVVVLGMMCVTGSFAVGVQTAGDVRTISPLKASEQIIGDMNDNGRIDEDDVAIILEVVKGSRAPTPMILRRDPSGDGQLTIDDAMRLLRDLASH